MKLLLVSVWVTANWACGQVITTVAGADFAFPSRPLPAINAPVGSVSGVAIDGNGNVYFSDIDNDRVMKVDSNGTSTIVAGNGFRGFSGDGGPATSAALFLGDEFAGLAVDATGNLFIVDNQRIRKVTPNGIITTVAGNGVQGLSGDGDGGHATSASLGSPRGVAVDPAGNLFFADTYSQRIRKVTPNGIITTVAGNGRFGFSGDGGPATSASLNFPSGLAVDGVGNLFIADTDHQRIRKVTANGIITTVAGNGEFGSSGDGGPAISASLSNPSGLALDTAGNLFITDVSNRVRKVAPNGIITTGAGNGRIGFSGDGGPAFSASLNSPRGVAVDATGNIFVADAGNKRIRKVTPNGTIATLAGNGAYGFCGDGGPAIAACLLDALNLVVDSARIVFIVTNNRVRRVTPNGIITTLAGNGESTFSGDGGPASSASLYWPTGVALDAAGNLFIADTYNFRIRKITPNGIITTVGDLLSLPFPNGGTINGAALSLPSGVAVDAAGNLFVVDYLHRGIGKVTSNGIVTAVAGISGNGFSGDGGPATSAALDGPSGVAVDGAGNLFIADTFNHRIRKVTPNGIITTVAGTGQNGGLSGRFSGDGGPATSASLNSPNGVAVDPAGNLFIADTRNNRIRKVTPNGIITTVAGNGRFGFSGDGGPATSASLRAPSGVAVDATGNLFIADSGNNRIRVVLTTPPLITASAQRLAFAGQTGGLTPESQVITISASVPNLPFSVSVSTSDGGSWLSADVASGATPRLVGVSANPFSLSPGTYSGSVTIRTPVGAPETITLPLSLTVAPGSPPSLAVDRDSVSFTFPKDVAARSETVQVRNVGGGPLGFSAVSLTDAGGAWLTVSPQNGAAIPSEPVPLSVRADPAGLSAGTYTGKIIIAGVSIPDRVTLPVTMTISTSPSALLLSQTGLSFIAIEQGGIVPPQNFDVLNLGTGPLPISVSASTLTGAWLAADATQSPTVDVSARPGGLAAGRYYGLVNVQSAEAANSPQVLTSLLEVLPRGTDLGAVLQPNELTFNAPTGDSSPSSQGILVYNLTAAPKTFRSSISESWLAILPQSATVQPDQPVSIIVQPRSDGLAAGTYRGSVTLQFDDGRVRRLGINLAVTPSPANGEAKGARPADADCKATHLLPAVTSLGNDFTVPAGWPVALQVQVQDDCGTPLESGSVVAEFSNGDPPVSLKSLRGGRWDGTWQSRRTQSGVTVTVKASAADRLITGARQVSGGLRNSAEPPVVTDAGVSDAASGIAFRPLSPGTLITISGDRLADQNVADPPVPLGPDLGSASVLMAGQLLPLARTEPGKIAAIIPYGISINTRHQMIVRRGATYFQPVSVNLAAASPAVFVREGNRGMIYVNGNPVIPGAAAKAGDEVTIYCTGLGTLDAAVNAGTYGPASSSTLNPVAVSIGGKSATVNFQGLAPGLVGIYFVRAVVPNGVEPSDQVPVSITALTSPPAESPPVTLAVQ